MRKNNISEALGIVVSLSGVIVMAGWFLRIEVVKSILPGLVTMKFSTALSFFLSGIVLYFIARIRKGDSETAVIVIPVVSMVILLLMASLLASTFIGINVGVEEMFVTDSMTPVGSVMPGRPSVATMLNFILMAITGITASIHNKDVRRALPACGAVVAIIGLTAIAGYCANHPLLYFSAPGRSSAMAIHTAILFVMWGAGLVLTKRDT